MGVIRVKALIDYERRQTVNDIRLEWDKLLCAKREKASSKEDGDYRNDFENDYDRIIFSSSFRRLQDKAQVFPLERNDFVRTRLTHSMEVAGIARSIGISLSAEMLKKGIISRTEYKEYIPVILETAGLAHDIGNPPFGHFGEETLRNAFNEWMLNHTEFEFGEQQKSDLLHFDGNSQMFRILTRLQCIKDDLGMHLTYATLATLMKYPFNSIKGNRDKEYCKENGVHYKKFGYFYSEKDVAEDVLKETGLTEYDMTIRHPLTYVLEAADDIAYSAADLEDGYKKKLFRISDVLEAFGKCEENDEVVINAKKQIEEILYKNEYYSEEKKLQDIRIYLQGVMIRSTVDAFVDNYVSIMDGTFKSELLEASKARNIRNTLKEFAQKRIFSSSEIEKTELGGEEILKYLTERFLEAFGNKDFLRCIVNGKKKDLTQSQRRMYHLISDDFKKVFEDKLRDIKSKFDKESEMINEACYYCCLMIFDYISGMTDGFCVDLYKRLKGITSI